MKGRRRKREEERGRKEEGGRRRKEEGRGRRKMEGEGRRRKEEGRGRREEGGGRRKEEVEICFTYHSLCVYRRIVLQQKFRHINPVFSCCQMQRSESVLKQSK